MTTSATAIMVSNCRSSTISSWIERMLELHKRHPNTPPEQEALAREIRDPDDQIDKLVYELYGLTQEESAIVEGKPAS